MGKENRTATKRKTWCSVKSFTVFTVSIFILICKKGVDCQTTTDDPSTTMFDGTTPMPDNATTAMPDNSTTSMLDNSTTAMPYNTTTAFNNNTDWNTTTTVGNYNMTDGNETTTQVITTTPPTTTTTTVTTTTTPTTTTPTTTTSTAPLSSTDLTVVISLNQTFDNSSNSSMASSSSEGAAAMGFIEFWNMIVDFYNTDDNLAIYLMVPLTLFIYGGAAVVYLVGSFIETYCLKKPPPNFKKSKRRKRGIVVLSLDELRKAVAMEGKLPKWKSEKYKKALLSKVTGTKSKAPPPAKKENGPRWKTEKGKQGIVNPVFDENDNDEEIINKDVTRNVTSVELTLDDEIAEIFGNTWDEDSENKSRQSRTQQKRYKMDSPPASPPVSPIPAGKRPERVSTPIINYEFKAGFVPKWKSTKTKNIAVEMYGDRVRFTDKFSDENPFELDDFDHELIDEITLNMAFDDEIESKPTTQMTFRESTKVASDTVPSEDLQKSKRTPDQKIKQSEEDEPEISKSSLQKPRMSAQTKTLDESGLISRVASSTSGTSKINKSTPLQPSSAPKAKVMGTASLAVARGALEAKPNRRRESELKRMKGDSRSVPGSRMATTRISPEIDSSQARRAPSVGGKPAKKPTPEPPPIKTRKPAWRSKDKAVKIDIDGITDADDYV
ncbi:uncharacterized protein LOC106152555 [Lingula anatina]|uniref:Uncharacterized protein LOC106152555 n=1 Tax=Lingula anatina TaxID=7574 RepID=A0A1S3H923_LINAN|nr:uncharacterized protein LOC106152555 [Lingula anatina]|eukprot:XP_013381624.1 uncharacterized protein LOC106152555 [Lingula anatina]